MKSQFHEINIQTWPRGQIFYYFTKIAPTGYSLTVDLDVTQMRKVLRENNKKFYPAYLYLVTKILNRQIEFKIAEREGILGYWNILTPMYATFHEDDQTFSLMWSEYDDNFEVFYNRYLENNIKYGGNHGILSQPDNVPPENCYTISCVPWIEFKHFAIHSYSNKPYYFPSVEAGKFYKAGNKTLMPLSLTLHHATTDGYHVKVFLEELQNDMNHPEIWIC